MRKSRAGFTIVEILAVLAIIVILIGLLSPALGKIRRISRRTQCANNLHQLGVAFHLYALGNNGNFPEEPWGERLYSDYIDDAQVFDCPVHDYAGVVSAPDYWYVAGLNDNSSSGTYIAGCYDGCHDGLENKLTVDGRVIAEAAASS